MSVLDPPGPTLRRFSDAETLSRAAAEEVCSTISRTLHAKDRMTLVLSGGSTPRRLYEQLASDGFRARVQWDRVEFFWGDERGVPPDHPESNYRTADEALLRPLGIPGRCIHRIEAERENRAAAARDYEATIARTLPASGGTPPAFDLVLLGMGADGHTASLFPHSPALEERKRWVVAHKPPQIARDRITMTVPLLNAAACVVFLVAGAKKAKVLAEVIDGPRDPGRLPSQSIRPTSGRLLWLVDAAAAAALPPERLEDSAR